MLPINRSRPILIFTDDAEDSVPPAIVIVVDAREVIVVPFEIGYNLMLVLLNSCSQVIAEKERIYTSFMRPGKSKAVHPYETS